MPLLIVFMVARGHLYPSNEVAPERSTRDEKSGRRPDAV